MVNTIFNQPNMCLKNMLSKNALVRNVNHLVLQKFIITFKLQKKKENLFLLFYNTIVIIDKTTES